MRVKKTRIDTVFFRHGLTRINTVFFLFTFTFLLLVQCLGGEELRFDFKPGDKYLLSSVTEEKITRTIDANQQVLNQTTRLECDLDIDEVDENGFAWAKYTYRRTAQKITGPNIDVDFDSNIQTRKINRQSLPMLLVIGERFYIRISPQGRIDKINGLQDVLTDVKSNIIKIPDRDRLLVINSIDEMLSESTIKRTLEERLAVFPDSNHNSQWSRTVDVPSKKIVQKWSYRIKSSKDGIIIVDVNLQSTPSADTEEVVRGGMTYRRQTSGSGQGQIEIDLNAIETHPIIKNVIKQDLTEELKVSSQGPLLRVPKIAEPIQAHIESTFIMTRREPPGKTGEPNQSADTNR